MVYSDNPYEIAANTKKVVTFTSEELPNYTNESEWFIFPKSEFVDSTSYVEYGGVKYYLNNIPSGSDALVIQRQYKTFNAIGFRYYTDVHYPYFSGTSVNAVEFKCYNMRNINVWSGAYFPSARKQKSISFICNLYKLYQKKKKHLP